MLSLLFELAYATFWIYFVAVCSSHCILTKFELFICKWYIMFELHLTKFELHLTRSFKKTKAFSIADYVIAIMFVITTSHLLYV